MDTKALIHGKVKELVTGAVDHARSNDQYFVIAERYGYSKYNRDYYVSEEELFSSVVI